MMDEYNIKLLKFALKMGQQAIDNVYETADFCENLSNNYFCMKTELAKILGVEYDDLSN